MNFEGRKDYARSIKFIRNYLFAIKSCLYLFTFGFLLRKNRDFIYQISKLFGYKHVNLLLPRIALADAVHDGDQVQLLDLASDFGGVGSLELIVIAKFIRQLKPRQVLEIGTHRGRTTLNIAANCEESTTIYTLDLPPEMMLATRLCVDKEDRKYINKQISGEKFIGTIYAERIIQLYGDSASFDFSPYYNSIDFIFIDGSHSYDYVMNDSRLALKLLRNGHGLIIWHDYDAWDGVTQALNELFTQDDEFKGLRNIEGTSFVYALF
jgi:hypothetical protein